MDVRQLLGDGLLQDTKRDADGLQVLGARGDVDVDGLEPGVVDDGVLDGAGVTSMKGTRRW